MKMIPWILIIILGYTAFPQCDCNPYPPPAPSESTVIVSNAAELQEAVNSASGPTTIYLENGIYDVSSLGAINVSTPDLTIRSLSGDRNSVFIDGSGMGASSVEHGFYINASRITIADLTIGNIGNHALFIAPANEPSDILIYNVRCVDAGEQLVKGSGIEQPKNNGRIECSVFEYTTTLDQGDYTNGIDLLNCHNWVIRNNVIRNIKAGPGGVLAGPAILIWHGSSGTIIENNRIIDCDMGIFFGNSGQTSINHTGGIIRNNFIKGYTGSDAAIGLVRATDAEVLHNSIYSEGSLPWSIEVRYTLSTNNTIMNNLMDDTILLRDGATATLNSNIETAQPTWYVNAATGDLHLANDTVPAVDAGAVSSNRNEDIDCQIPSDGSPDIGADEYGAFSGRKGDINGDGRINILDGSLLISIVYNTYSPNAYEFWAADVHVDIQVDIADFLPLVSLIWN